MSSYQNYINNEFVDPAEFHDVLNPSTGGQSYPPLSVPAS